MIARTWIWIGGAALFAGGLADLIGLPAAWMLGPMLASIFLTMRKGLYVTIPPWLWSASLGVIGMAVSSSFTPEAFALLAQSWLPVVAAVAVVLGLSLVSGTILARISNLDRTTALLGSIPGGASAMVAMSDELHADARLVAFIQYARVILVIVLASLLARIIIGPADAMRADTSHVLVGIGWQQYIITIVPTAIGIWIGVRVGIPAGALIGPVVIGAGLGVVGIEHGIWPPGVLPLANAVIGISVGLRFDTVALRQIGRAAIPVLACIVGLIMACAGVGLALAYAMRIDWLSAYLATMPGGLDAVTIAALDTGAQTPIVLLVHLLRLFVMVSIGPLLVRRMTQSSAAAPKT